MTNIAINISQTVENTNYILQTANGRADFSDVVDLFFQAAYSFSSNHFYYSSYSSVGSTLRINFSDGAYSQYSGVVLADPNVTSGIAYATSVTNYVPSAFQLSESGNFTYNYNLSPSLEFYSSGGVLTAASIRTLIPTYSSSYNSIIGNVTYTLNGYVNYFSSANFDGTITSLIGKADKFLDSSTITGNFQINGNVLKIGQSLSSTSLVGILSSYNEFYKDGSSIVVTSAAIPVTGSTVIDKTTLANPNNFPLDDQISVVLPATVHQSWRIASGGGDDRITLAGGGGQLSADGGVGNDVFTLLNGVHSIDGGSGIDTVVYSGARKNYTVTATARVIPPFLAAVRSRVG